MFLEGREAPNTINHSSFLSVTSPRYSLLFSPLPSSSSCSVTGSEPTAHIFFCVHVRGIGFTNYRERSKDRHFFLCSLRVFAIRCFIRFGELWARKVCGGGARASAVIRSLCLGLEVPHTWTDGRAFKNNEGWPPIPVFSLLHPRGELSTASVIKGDSYYTFLWNDQSISPVLFWR